METFTQKGRTPFSKRSSICSWLFGLIFLFSGFIGGQAQVAVLNITKTGPTEAEPGDIITYVIHFWNSGTAYATNVVVTDYLPSPGLYTYVSSIPAGIYNSGTNKITWTSAEMPILASLGAGDNQIVVKVRAGTKGANVYHPAWDTTAYYMPGSSTTPLNYASIQSTGIGPVNSSTVSTQVEQACGVVIDDMHGETKSSTDYVAYFLMNLTNEGNINDNFLLSAVEASGSQVPLIVEFTDLNHNPITSSGWIAPNDVFFFYLKVTTPNGTPANTYNLTDVTAQSTVCINTSYTTTVNIKVLNPLGPVLNIIKSDNPDPVFAGNTITYTLFILNTGKSSAENFMVTENYSADVDFVSASPAPTTGNNIWNLPNLAVGASVTITITVAVHPNLPNGTLIINTAIASGTDNHGNVVSDTDTEKTTVHSAPDLQITKTAVPTPFPAKPDRDIIYTLTYTNIGNYPATGVVISDNYDEVHTYVTNTGGGTDNGFTISWNIGTLPVGAGGSVTYTVKIRDVSFFGPGTTSVPNTATIMLNEVDEDYSNNVASVVTLVNLLPDLSVSKTASANPAHVGSDFDYTIAVANNGDISAQTTVLQDVLPANLQFVSASNGGTETNGVVTWNLGTMGISASLQRTVTVRPLCASAGNITNTVSVHSPTVDANETDNTYSLTTTVTDNISPVITCPSNISQNVDPTFCYAMVNVPNPTVTDNCGVTAVTWVMTGATTGSSPVTGINYIGTHQFNVGITTITYTAKDAAANSTSCSFTVTITDNIPPTITCPGNQVRNANTGVCSYTAVGSEFDPTSFSDHCPGTTVSNNLNSGATLAGYVFPKGITTVIWTARDASANTATCSFTVTVNDNQAPTITCPGNQTRNTNLNVCTYTAVGTEFDPVGFGDPCPGATISNNLNSNSTLAGFVFAKGTTTVIWTVTDASSNTATCSFTVNVTDIQAPSVTCPGFIQVINDAGVCGAVVNYTVTYSDNCPGETLSQLAGRPSGSVFPVGNTVNTFLVTDASGNTASCTFTVQVKDIELPTISCPSNITKASDPGVCGAVVNFTVNASDNCPGYVISQVAGLASGSTFPVGTTNNTFRVTDASGNSSTCSFSVTITDGQAPSITCPGNQTRNTNLSVCQYTTVGTEFDPVNFSDNCPGTTVRNNLNLNSTLAGYVFTKGITNVIWTATDAAGNSTTCSFTVTVNDNEYPSIECQTDKVRNTDPGVCYYTVIGTEFNPAGFNDNCGGATILNNFNSSNTLAGAHFPKGVTVVTWTVTDASNNATSCSFTVTVNDVEKPTISCVTNQTRNANNGTCTYTTIGSEFDPTAYSDNCPGPVIVNSYNSQNTLANAIFPKGTTSVTWIVTDASGNTKTCSFTVTVSDTELPTISCVGNQSRNTNAGVCSYTAVGTEFDPVTFNDNCTGSTVANSFNGSSSLAGASFPKGITTVTWTVTDATGNTASCSFTVTVSDPENPTITCPVHIFQAVDAGHNYATIATPNPITGDNCAVTLLTWTLSGATTGSSPATGINYLGTQIFYLGVTTVVYVVGDAAGNTATCSFDITVTDNEAPVITCPGNITQNVDPGVCHAMVVNPNPVITDNGVIALVTWTLSGATTGSSPATGINYVGTQQFNVGVTTVSYYVEDEGGNPAGCSYTVTVLDNINPTISCPSNITQNTDAGFCHATVSTPDPISNDNCTVTEQTWMLSGATTGNSPATGIHNLGTYIFNKGVTTVTYTVKDAAGNTGTCGYTVTVNDNENPVITCKANQVRSSNNGVCTYTAVGGEFDPVSFNDNCPGSTILNNYNSTNTLAGAIFPKGTTTILWTVTDASGNTATCSFTVTVNDNENPSITCPGNKVRSTNPGLCTYTVVGTEFDPVSFADNCTGSTLINNFNSSNTLAGAIFPKGTTTVLWTVTDASGNTATCSFPVTVNDNENPTITCPGVQTRSANNGLCTYTAVGGEFDPVTYNDNCPGSTIMNYYTNSSSLAGAIFPKGTTSVIWKVTDASGNTATCSFNVIVNDNENPTLTCVTNQVRNTNTGVCTYTTVDGEFDPVGFNDNCTGSTILNNYNNNSTLAGAIFPKGATTVIWTVTDASGNTASCSFTVTVSDNEDPTITCPGNIIQNVDPSQSYATITPPDPITGDNCSVVLLTWNMSGATTGSSPATGINYVGTQLFNLGVTTINYHVEDAAGNSADCSFTITVNDNVPPVITCPSNISQNVDAGVCYATVVNPNPVITDNGLIALVTWTLSGATTGSSPATGINYVGTQQFNVGVTTVSYYVEDAAGNSAACSYTVTVVDNLPPTITCPSDLNQTTDEGACQATIITPDPATGDNCSVTGLTWALSGATTGSSAPTGINNIGIYAFNKGITIVTYTVTDASGNSASCSFTVTVTDDEEPTISCLTDQVRTTDPGVCTYTTVGNEFEPVAFSDNCTGSTISNDYNSSATLSGAIFPKGTTTVIWTVTDASGNTATCSFTVTVNDGENPTITCVANQTRNANSGVCTYTAIGNEFDPVSFNDNCPGSAILNNYNNSSTLAGAIFPNGTTTVTWTVTDAAGNTATCSFTVTVNDNEDPYIGCVEDQGRNTDPGVCTYTAVGTEFDPLTFYDNCPGAIISNDFNSSSTLAGAIFPKGTTIIIWTVTDASGNTATCSFTLTVSDVEDPSITCVENQVRSTDPGVCTYTAVGNEFDPASFSDNCTGSIISNDYNSGSTLAGAIFPKGTHTITWTVTDASGNTAVCSFTLTVNDTEDPTLTCVGNQVRSTDPGVCTYTVVGGEFDPVAFSDNCTGSTISNDYNSGSTLAGAIFQKGTTTVIWTVTDASGNSTTCSFTVTINDTEDPTISCVTDQTRNTDAGVCTYTAVGNEFNPVGFNDNCPGSSVSNDFNGTATLAGAVFPKGTTTVTWTITDASGNTATCSFTLTVIDQELPTITCPANIVQLVDPLTCFATVTVPLPVITDNCPGVYAINDFNGTGNASGIYPAGITIVVWTVYDESGNSATCVQTIEITNFPVANDDNATTLEDTPVTVPVLANDSDCENSMLPSTVTIVTPPAHGTTSVDNISGDITYSPNLNYYGPDVFSYRVCNADALCDTASVFINVLPVNDPPAIINENISLCENTMVNGNVLANGDADTVENTTLTVTLPQVSGPAHGTFTLLANGDFTYTPTAHYFGSDMVIVSICDNGFPLPPQCVNDTIFINVMEAVTAVAGPDQELCNATSTTLSGSSPVPGTGNWTQVDGPNTVTILPQNSPNATVTGMIPGTYHFMYTVTTGTCATMDSMVVVNYNAPTPANAGADQDLCLNGNPSTSTVMAANTPQFGTGLWAQISGPTTAVIANPTSPTTTVSNLVFGVYQFTWSVSIGVCSPSVDTVQLSVWYLSSANAGPDATICEGDSMHLEGSTASNYLTLLWGTTGSGTFTNPNILNPTYIPSMGDITAGTVKLYLTSFGHAPCVPVADTMVLTIIRAAIAEAGPDISTCQMQPITITTASASFYTSVLWTHNGQGTLLNNNTLTPTYTPAPTETGTVTLILTAYGNSPCGMDVDSTHLAVVPFPDAEAGPDGYSCQNIPFTIYNASATNYAAVLWTENGPGYLTNANTLTPTYYPAPDEIGDVMLVMQVWGLSPCGVTSDFMYIHFNEEAVVTAGADLLSCSQNSVALDQAVAKNYSWLHWHTSGTGTFNDSTILHPIYYPSAQDVIDGSVKISLTANGLGACPDVSDTLVLSLTAPPVVDAGENEASCIGVTFVINDATVENYTSVLWTHNGAGVLNNPTTLTPTYVPAPTETGNITFTLTVQGIEPCAGNADQKIVTINPQAVVSAGPDAQICEDEDYTVADASGQNYEDVSWQSTGTGTFDDPLLLNPTYMPSASDITQGSVKLILTATPLGGCPPASDTLLLTISKLPVVAAGPDAQVCPGTLILLDDATASNYSTVQWTANGVLLETIPGTLSVNYFVPNPSPGVINMEITVWGTGGCADRSVSDGLLLIAKPAPMVDAGPDQAIAPNTSTTLEANVWGGSGDYSYSWTPGSYLVNPSVEDPATVILNSTITFILSVTDNSSGCVTSDTMTVNVAGTHLPPVAVNDYDSTYANIPVTLDPMANDYDPAGSKITYEILEGPFVGQVNPISDSLLSYTPMPNFEGNDSIIYVIYDSDAIPESDTAVMYIHIGGEIPLNIHNVITPNGDGFNDTWIIDGIDAYQDNDINIFNRWGDKVKSFTGYNNTSVVWNGTNRHNEPLPDGTYFYIINLPNVGHFKGWVYIRVNSQ